MSSKDSKVDESKENVLNIQETSSGGLCYKFRMATSLEDIRSLMLWKAIFAEFLGTLLLVLIGSGSILQSWNPEDKTLDVVQIGVCFGLAVATIVWIIGHISGGHINPAVTCAMLVTRRISLVRAILFIGAQLVGAIIGSALLKVFTPTERRGALGATTLGEGVTGGMAFGIEFFITLALVLTVFASCDSNRKDLNGSFPLTIGLSITMAHMWAVSKGCFLTFNLALTRENLSSVVLAR